MNKFNLLTAILFFSLFTLSSTEKDELVLRSENGYYRTVTNQKVFVAQGNAYILIDNNEIYCDEIEIFMTSDDRVEKAIFRRNIRIFQIEDEIEIGGEYAEYIKRDKRFVIRENAFYIDVKEEVAVFGDSIYSYEEEKVAIVQGNVRIFQKDIFARGAFVKYTRTDKRMEISGFPTVESKGSVYSARKIVVDVENNTFILEGGLEAKIINESSSPNQQTESQQMGTEQ